MKRLFISSRVSALAVALVMAFAMLLAGCSSDYQPSQKMRALKQQMNKEQARNVLQQRLWDADAPQGICGSRGFWYDSNANMEVHNDRIAMLAHRRGELLRKHPKKIGEVMVFEKQYYRYDFLFDRITRVDIYKDARLLPVFPDCNKKNIEGDYFIIDLYVDELNNLKFIVLPQTFNETMAALGILLPDTPVFIR